MSEKGQKEVEEEEEADSEEEKMRIRRKVRGIRTIGPREEDNKEEEKKEFEDIGKKPGPDTQMEEETIVESEGSSGKPDTQISGVTMKESETGLTTEEASEREDTEGKEKESHIGCRKDDGLWAVCKVYL